MIKRKDVLHKFITAIMFVVAMGLAFMAVPAGTVSAAIKYDHVFDGRELFSDSQRAGLEEMAKEYSEKMGGKIVIATTAYESGTFTSTNDPIYYDTLKFSDMMYAALLEEYGDSYEDCVIFSINVVDPDDSWKRYADVSGRGIFEKKLDNSRCQLIFDRIKGRLSGGQYFEASCEVIKRAARYSKVMPGINPEGIYLKLWFQLGLSLLVALIIILVMINKSKGRMTVSGNTYLDKNNARILGQYDRYIRTVTTKRKIETSSSGGHGGGSHGGGGGGGSHGGGHF